jgi:perosamine synthetase
MSLRIPLAKPEITRSDQEAVLEVLRSSRLSMGPKVAEFEHALCEYTGSKYAIAVNSGTSALQLAIRMLELEPGAEVLLPAFTFSAPLNVLLEEGLRPRFVDIDPDTYNSDLEPIAAALSGASRLILAVHTFGFPVDSERLKQLASERGVHLVEDACEALGAVVRGHKVGTLGEAGVYAFYPNKQITTGEGGVLLTSEEKIATRARRLRNQGRDPVLDWYDQTEVGFSYRLADMNCALGISQLVRIEATISRRQQLASLYDREISTIDGVLRPPLTVPYGRISWFCYPVQLAREFDRAARDAVCRSLSAKGIGTGRYFSPLHRQPVLGGDVSALFEGGRLVHTEAVADRVITLPFFNELTEREIHEVSGALDESIRELRRKR